MPFLQAPPKWDVANTASKLPRPLQRPAGMALEALRQAFGGDDPSGIMQTGAPTPMISIYKDAAGVPSAALRAEGTKRFLQSAKDTAIHGMDTASELFAGKYPRIAAHMNLIREPKYDLPMMGETRSPYGKVTKPINIHLSPEQPHPLNILTHEGTHVAQSLGNSDALELYDLMNEHRDVGYRNNPFEKTADYAAQRAEARPPGYYTPNTSNRPWNAIKAIKSLMSSDQRNYITLDNPKDEVLKILKRRAETPFPPR